MIPHIISTLVLLVFAVETYRTIRRFGVRREGSMGIMVESPGLHMTGAVVFGLLFAWAASTAWVPDYVGYVGGGVAVIYFIATVIWKIKRPAPKLD